MNSAMYQTKITSKGQITLPVEIQKVLGVGVGDRITFIVNGSSIIVANSAICALKLLQDSVKGKAQEAGLFNEDDVQKMLDEERKQRWLFF